MPIEIADDNDERPWTDNPDYSEFYRPWIEPIQHLGWQMGYNIAVHGTLRRDLDMIAVPWIEGATSAEALAWAVFHLIKGFEPYMETKYNPLCRPHGRKSWSIHFFNGNVENIHRYVDLSIMPRREDLS